MTVASVWCASVRPSVRLSALSFFLTLVWSVEFEQRIFKVTRQRAARVHRLYVATRDTRVDTDLFKIVSSAHFIDGPKSRKHYVFGLSIRLCVLRSVRERVEAFINRIAVDFKTV